jgi:hypothetical protein
MGKATVQADQSCSMCGQTFLVQPWRQHRAKFYSAQCRNEANRRGPVTAESLRAQTRELPSGCWEWTGSKTTGGYGTFLGTTVHRLMYEATIGPIPDGFTIDHVKTRGCASRACIRPEHLEAVTQRENNLRGEGPAAQRARQTHCKHGHLFDDTNVRVRANGTRQCRICAREQVRRAYWRRKAAE